MKRSYSVMALTALFMLAMLVALTSPRWPARTIESFPWTKTVTSALSSGNEKAAEKLLDADFIWIDTKGVMREKD
jgi:hypothetical protein